MAGSTASQHDPSLELGRPDFSPIGKIVLTWLFMPLIAGLYFLRLWIQRHRKGSPARLAADILSWSAWVIALTSNIMITWEYVELHRWDKIRPHNPKTHPYIQIVNKKVARICASILSLDLLTVVQLHFYFTLSYFCVAWGIKGIQSEPKHPAEKIC